MRDGRKAVILISTAVMLMLAGCGDSTEEAGIYEEPEYLQTATVASETTESVTVEQSGEDLQELLNLGDELDGQMVGLYTCSGEAGPMTILLYASSRTDANGNSCGSTFGQAIYSVNGQIYDTQCWSAVSPYDSTCLDEFYINIDSFDGKKISYLQYRFTKEDADSYSYVINQFDL